MDNRLFQFVLPFHQLFKLLIDDLEAAFFFLKSLTKAVLRRFLILMHLLEGILEGDAAFLLRFLREEHFPAFAVNGHQCIATRAADFQFLFSLVHIEPL